MRPGARSVIAAGLLALLAPAAQADEDSPECKLAFETPQGFLTIDPRKVSGGPPSMELKFATSDDIVGADGSTSTFTLWGIGPIPETPDGIPQVLDDLMVTLQFGDARRVKAPALIYYTRDNTIPLDIAPAKLWYPEYHTDSERLEISMTLGDLERDMSFGPGEQPATVLSWIAKQIGNGPLDEKVVAYGEMPLASLREARSAMGSALEQVVTARANGAC